MVQLVDNTKIQGLDDIFVHDESKKYITMLVSAKVRAELDAHDSNKFLLSIPMSEYGATIFMLCVM